MPRPETAGVTTYPCPFCRAVADSATGCPACGRAPDADAVEVIRLDGEIQALNARLQTARAQMLAAERAVQDAWQRRSAAAARVRAAVAAAPPASATPAVTPVARYPQATALLRPPAVPGPAPVPAGRGPEASTRLVQNALFLLGGVLLGVAAIVFTMVAWSQFGVGGRAALLAGFTVAALAVPPIALRRGLTATAETFAALGLLLVLLDGYAAWYVNLFGLANTSGVRYSGVVCAVTAVVAAGYAYATGLTGPRFVAMIVAQPALPLLVAASDPGITGASYTLAAVAAGNLAVLRLRRARFAFTGVGVAAYLLGALAVAGALLAALVALLLPDSVAALVAASGALLTPVLLLVVAAVLARSPIAQALSGGLLVGAFAVAGVRLVVASSDGYEPILIAVLVAVLAAAVTVVARWLPAPVRVGPWAGALVVVALPAMIGALAAAVSASRSIIAAMPPLNADPSAVMGRAQWQVPAALAVLTAAVTILVTSRTTAAKQGASRTAAMGRPAAVAVPLVGAALVALAVPVGFGLPWSTAVAFDLLVAAAALTLAVRGSVPVVAAPVAVVLGGHAVLVGFGAPGLAVATLTAVGLLAFGTAAAAWARPVRMPLGGPALTAGLLTVPAVAWTATLALDLSPQVQARATVAATALLGAAAHLVARRWSGYRGFALAAVVTSALALPIWALAAGDSPAVYAALALIVVAFVAPLRSGFTAAPAALLGAALALAVAPSVVEVLAGPYRWWEQVWAGAPAGTGLDPAGRDNVAVADVVAIALLAAAGALWIAGYRAARRHESVAVVGPVAAVVALALPMALAAAGFRWPTVPLASLLTGLICLILVARTGGVRAADADGGRLAPAGESRTTPAVAWWSAHGVRVLLLPLGVVLAGAGLSGALPTRAATLVALGLVAVAGVCAGSAGRTVEARVAGWLGATAALFGFAFTVGRAAGLPLASSAFGVAGAAAAILVLGTVLALRRRVDEGRAVQAAAHAGAVLALLLTLGQPRHAAAICTLWGLLLGIRALAPGETTGVRRVLIVTAAAAELLGWWLIVASAQVSTVEVYSLPAAAVALLAGWLARRTWPGITSWTAYGVALAAALLPTLAVVVATDDDAWRRLLLGVGALAVVVTGARARLRAPVVTGGAVLLAVALHELVLVWDLLPRWLPLAGGGLLLVGLAITLERRRRDLARIRAALARMS